MIYQKKKGFTLVELIVVMTILAILGTIAFISLQGYSLITRDSVRISDIGNIEKSLELAFLKDGEYPDTSEGDEITYKGGEAREQGIYGELTYSKVGKLNKIPKDPLTGIEYTYSVTTNNREYEVAGIMEGDDVALNTLMVEANADGQNAHAMIRGHFNGQLLKVETGSTVYVLAIPTLINGDMTFLKIEDIFSKNKGVFNGYRNLPGNYSGSIFEQNGETDLDLINYEDIEVFSGSLNRLKIDKQARIDLILNLQDAYTGVTIIGEKEIEKILRINGTDESSLLTLGNQIVNDNLGGGVVLDDTPTAFQLKSIKLETTTGTDYSFARIKIYGENGELLNFIDHDSLLGSTEEKYPLGTFSSHLSYASSSYLGSYAFDTNRVEKIGGNGWYPVFRSPGDYVQFDLDNSISISRVDIIRSGGLGSHCLNNNHILTINGVEYPVPLAKDKNTYEAITVFNAYKCATKPSYENAKFISGNPTSNNMSWQNSDSGQPCYYSCVNSYTGADCSIAPTAFQLKSIKLETTTGTDYSFARIKIYGENGELLNFIDHDSLGGSTEEKYPLGTFSSHLSYASSSYLGSYAFDTNRVEKIGGNGWYPVFRSPGDYVQFDFDYTISISRVDIIRSGGLGSHCLNNNHILTINGVEYPVPLAKDKNTYEAITVFNAEE